MESKAAAASSDLSMLEQSPALVDQVIRSAMHAISEEHQQQADALQLERQRLSVKYGPDSAQARTSAMRLELHDQMKLGIKLQRERLSLKTPETSTNYYMVYGRVLNTEGDGLPKLEVSAVDLKSQVVAQTVTDDEGVFELPIPAAGTKPRIASGIDVKDVPLDTEAQLRLQVSDQRNKILYRDQEAFQPANGRLSYREIVVSPAAKPKAKKKSSTKQRA